MRILIKNIKVQKLSIFDYKEVEYIMFKDSEITNNTYNQLLKQRP